MLRVQMLLPLTIFISVISAQASPARFTPAPYAVLGDSLAVGYGTSDTRFAPAKCLENAFGRTVKEVAVKGFTSENILKRVKKITGIQPEVVFLSAGGNDVIKNYFKPGTYPKEKSLQVMEELFDQLLASGAKVVYLGLDPGVPEAERLPLLADLARAKGAVAFDGMKGFWNDPNLMYDEIHPNTEGYRILCERLVATVKTL